MIGINLYRKFYFFFFQAEDGIRDYKVTGVQTCALPILDGRTRTISKASALRTETTARPEPNSSTPVPNGPRPPASPSWANPLMTDGSSAATLSASTPLAARASIGNPSRPTTTTASTPPPRPP